MKAQKHRRLLISILAIVLTLPVLRAQEVPGTPAGNQKPSVGAIVGVIRNATRAPIAGAMITAAKADGTGLRATISGSDGLYSFADVLPGEYSVSSLADGYLDTAISTIQVSGGKATRTDIVIAAPAPVQPVVGSSNSVPPVSNAPASSTTQTAGMPVNAARNMWSRWLKDMAAPARKAPVTTASLKNPPATAFDTAAASRDIPFPGPQDSRPGSAATPPTAPAATHKLPEALEAPDPGPEGVDTTTPFAFGDFTWLNGTPRNKDTVLDTKFFTPEVRFDTHYMEDFNQPNDHTIVGATESFRSGEVQIEQASVGGDFHWQNVRGRILFMYGLFATTTPRNDASAGVGQWDLRGAYKYVSEAWGGYHFNVNHGLNVDAGIFVSYIGLFSYYNFDNWTYQPSYVSSNTPWFFNGVRVQWFPTNKLKIEPWFINGWQSYAKFNGHLGLGGQILWEPKEWFKLVANQYGYGQDNLGLPKTQRIHTDDSIEVRYYNNPKNARASRRWRSPSPATPGCQYGGGICGTCAPSQDKSHLSDGCSTTASGSTRICLRLRSAAER